ncbi:MAG: GIY-YIG nuclease [Parcubacteria group bacterium]|nr:GIY-YIG nuclease [Parcubacteria group bacterium]
MNKYYVYIVASKRNGTLYIGVTNDVMRRAYEHREKMVQGFTAQYNVTRLVYFEKYDDIENAIKREKILKEWRRSWKIRLIEKMNPEWNDLYLFYQDGSRTATG